MIHIGYESAATAPGSTENARSIPVIVKMANLDHLFQASGHYVAGSSAPAAHSPAESEPRKLLVRFILLSGNLVLVGKRIARPIATEPGITRLEVCKPPPHSSEPPP